MSGWRCSRYGESCCHFRIGSRCCRTESCGGEDVTVVVKTALVTALYDGAKSCAIAHATSGGETGCTFGCLGCGDCVEACQFDAIHMNPETGLPEVDEEKCTACGACSKACPRKIIEIRPKGKNNRRVVVMCVNKDKGAVANKACKASCIGCGKCVKVCPFEAITLENNLAYMIRPSASLAASVKQECPKGAIQGHQFPAA